MLSDVNRVHALKLLQDARDYLYSMEDANPHRALVVGNIEALRSTIESVYVPKLDPSIVWGKDVEVIAKTPVYKELDEVAIWR